MNIPASQNERKLAMGIGDIKLSDSRCIKQRDNFNYPLPFYTFAFYKYRISQLTKKLRKLNSIALARKRTIPTEQPLVGELSAKFAD
jgi:hypothetical protein